MLHAAYQLSAATIDEQHGEPGEPALIAIMRIRQHAADRRVAEQRGDQQRGKLGERPEGRARMISGNPAIANACIGMWMRLIQQKSKDDVACREAM